MDRRRILGEELEERNLLLDPQQGLRRYWEPPKR
jgi:hypothetical protein